MAQKLPRQYDAIMIGKSLKEKRNEKRPRRNRRVAFSPSEAPLPLARDIDLVSTIRTMDHTSIEVPGPDARWWSEINDFALTYNGYNRNGDFDVVSGIDEQVRQAWDRDATLPDNLDICRATLFFEQRRYRHLDAKPVGDDDRFVRAVLGRIRDLTGGQISGPADELP